QIFLFCPISNEYKMERIILNLGNTAKNKVEAMSKPVRTDIPNDHFLRNSKSTHQLPILRHRRKDRQVNAILDHVNLICQNSSRRNILLKGISDHNEFMGTSIEK